MSTSPSASHSPFPFSRNPLSHQSFISTVSSHQVPSGKTIHSFPTSFLLPKMRFVRSFSARSSHHRSVLSLRRRKGSNSALRQPPATTAIIQAYRLRVRRINRKRTRSVTPTVTTKDKPEPTVSMPDTSKTSKTSIVSKGVLSRRRRKLHTRFRILRSDLSPKPSPPPAPVLESKSELEVKIEIEPEKPAPAPERKTSLVARLSLKLSLSQRRQKIHDQLHRRRAKARKNLLPPETELSAATASTTSLEQVNSATKRRDRRERMKRGRKQSDRGKQSYHTKLRNPNWKSGTYKH